ncbi:MAG TPA: alpha-N-arabinofuranosidase [Clostridia bacterium]|nr:alpha-N-arabinofuranosidase [Clostridia bacterium]
MTTDIQIDINNTIAKIDDRLYSSFIEHMGRAVYTGIYEPAHETADAAGFRQDVMELIQPLNLSCIRYPGGNFLSGYNWLDGIGPKDKRPMRPELAWFALEPNQVGTDEFLQWCERVGTKAMLGVNLGTGTPQSACDLLEYVNGTLPTQYADLRRANGHAEPYNVKLWCLGNEMDGPWQICAKTAEEYGRIASETAKMMKWLDPSIELVACGSSYRSMPTFGSWEQTVLAHCYPYIDYLSLHQYYQNNDGDVPAFLARSVEMEGFIREVADICRAEKAKRNSEKDVYLSFDEWNVWYHFQKEGQFPEKWTFPRAIEEELYDGADALLVGCMMNTLLRNADVVKIACLAQLVNTIAPIMTEPGGRAWIQTIYYPFLYASQFGRGSSLRVSVESPTYSCSVSDATPYVDASATLSADQSEIVLFLINRSMEEQQPCRISLANTASAAVLECVSLNGFSHDSVNTASATPVSPKTLTGCTLHNNILELALPKFSWNMVRIHVGAAE